MGGRYVTKQGVDTEYIFHTESLIWLCRNLVWLVVDSKPSKRNEYDNNKDDNYGDIVSYIRMRNS